ncbi:DUF4249 family protein [Prolixibacteraceae bacterium JC049]|nr:DUF4249 family protein [Prolixibacteraceae bacterium JC049]
MKYWPLYILFIVCNACTDLLDLGKSESYTPNPSDQKAEMITYCLLAPNRQVEVKVHRTLAINEPLSTDSHITNAKVNIIDKTTNVIYPLLLVKETNKINDTKTEISYKYVNNQLYPEVGNQYILKVEAAGYKSSESEIEIPEAIQPEHMEYELYSEANHPHLKMKCKVHFTDNELDKNYYMVLFDRQYKEVEKFNQTEEVTFSEITKNSSITLDDPVFRFLPDKKTSIIEPFEITYLKPRIFNDEVINGKKYGLQFTLTQFRKEYGTRYGDYSREELNGREWEEHNTTLFTFRLLSINKDLFEFYRSSYLNDVVKGDIYSRQYPLYSNMSNHFGIFGAYSEKTLTIELPGSVNSRSN